MNTGPDITQRPARTQPSPSAIHYLFHSMRAIGIVLARLLLLVLFLGSFFLGVFPQGRSALRSALLLPALISASVPAPLLATGEPIRFTRTTLLVHNSPVYLDTYEPTSNPASLPGKRAAIINIVGVGDNRNDPQLVNLSRAFAHEGIVVVNMGTPALFNFEISPQDNEAVVQTFMAISKRPDVDPQRIGIIGFSAGGTLACFAAVDPRLRAHLAFVTLFGSYFDANSLMRDFGRHALLVDGHSQPWQPNYVPTQVLANALQAVLSPTENMLFQHTFAQDGQPLLANELQQLSPGASAAYHLLKGDEPGRVEQNFATLTPHMHTLLSQLSPSSVYTQIRAPIYLLHDRSDQYLPFTQSKEFATALAHAHHTYDFAEFGIFQHVEVRSNNSPGQLFGDGTQLFRIISKMLLIAS